MTHDIGLSGKTLPELRKRRTALRGIIDRRRGAITIAHADIYRAEQELRCILYEISKIEAVKKGNRP